MRVCLTCDRVHGSTYNCIFQVSVWSRAEQTEWHAIKVGNKCETVKEKRKEKKFERWWCLASCRRVQRKGEKLSEGCMREVSDGVWRPVLVPPQLLCSQPVSGSLPSPPADFSLGGSEKNCPLSLWPTATAWALPCPPDINQHTCTHSLELTCTFSPVSMCEALAAGQPSLLQALHLQMRQTNLLVQAGHSISMICSCMSDWDVWHCKCAEFSYFLLQSTELKLNLSYIWNIWLWRVRMLKSYWNLTLKYLYFDFKSWLSCRKCIE